MKYSFIKAFLLAAGLGTRMRPLTNTTPKILLSINGRPILDIWLKHLINHKINEVLINTHWLRKKVDAFIENNRNDSIKIATFYEPSLLGSAGTLMKNANWVMSGDPFFILYGDNLTNVDLTKMLTFHKQHEFPFTLGVFRTANPTQCGIAEINRNGIVTNFEEKPSNPSSDFAAAGIYVANNSIFQFFPEQEKLKSGKPLDFGFHILPRLVNNMKAYFIDEFIMDIGTLESYLQAQRIWKEVN